MEPKHLLLEHVVAYVAVIGMIGILLGAAVMAFIHEINARTRIARRAAYEQQRYHNAIIRALDRLADLPPQEQQNAEPQPTYRPEPI